MPSPKINTGTEALAKLADEHLYLLESFLKDTADSAKTRRHYERVTALYLVFIQGEKVALQDCMKDTVKGFIRHQYGKIEPATQRNYLSVLSSFYDWLMGEDETKYQRNPALLARRGLKNLLKKSKTTKKQLNFFRGDQFEKVIETRRDTISIRPNRPQDIERDETILHVFFGSGLRKEEVHLLNVQHFDSKGGIFRLIGKGGKLRTPALLVESQEVLMHYLRDVRPLFNPAKVEDAMFLATNPNTSEGKRMTYEQIDYMVRKTLKATGLFSKGDGGTHVFRRSHGTHLKRQGVPIEDIQDQLDHANIATTEKHYVAQVEGERAKNIRDKVGIK